MNKMAGNVKEETSFSTVIVASKYLSAHHKNSLSIYQEEDPLANLDVPVEQKKIVIIKNQTFSEDPSTSNSNVSFLRRSFVMIEENTSQQCEFPPSDPLAVDPLHVCTSESLKMDIKNEEKEEQNFSCRKQKTEEAKRIEFPVTVVPSHLCSKKTPSNSQVPFLDPLAVDPLRVCISENGCVLKMDIKNDEEQNFSRRKQTEEAKKIKFPVTVAPSHLCSAEISLNSQVPSSDPLAVDPLNVLTSESLKMEIRNDEEEEEQNFSCRKQTEEAKKIKFPVTVVPSHLCSAEIPSNSQEKDPLSGILEIPFMSRIQSLAMTEPSDQRFMEEEENIPAFPGVIEPKNLHFEETMSREHQEKVPLPDILDASVSPRIPAMIIEDIGENANVPFQPVEQVVPALVKEESFQISEVGDAEPVLQNKSSNERHILERNEGLEEYGPTTLTRSFRPPNPSNNEEEMNEGRPTRKSAAAALASIHRSRVEYEEESSESDVSESDDYECPASCESSVSDEEASSRSVKKKTYAAPRPPATSSTTMSTIGSAIATSQLPLSTEMSSRLQASCGGPLDSSLSLEKCLSGSVEKECHSADSPLSHPEAHHRASTESHYLQNLVARKNRSCQQQFDSGLISSDVVSKPDVSGGLIAESNVCQNNIANLQALFVCKKSVSLLKPITGQTYKNQIIESTNDRVELDVHKKPVHINIPKHVKETLTVISPSSKAKSLLLHSKEQTMSADKFNSRNRNKEFKESEAFEDNIISTGAKENTQNLGEIIIHPVSGLLVSKHTYILSNNNNNNNTTKIFYYKCFKCSQIFTCDQYHQTHHPTNSGGGKSFACHMCGKNMSLHNELAEHYYRFHKRLNQIPCFKCEKTLRDKCALERHLNSHSSIRPHICKICSMAFKSVYDLRSHWVKHTDSKKFKCDQCNQSFKYSAGLTRHKYTHSETAPLVKCHICDKIYAKESLKRHLRTHSAERNFPCPVCDKSFVSKRGVRLHNKAIHEGIKAAHVCEVCGKVMRTITALNEHMNVHAGVKPYTCDVCGRGFPIKRHLAVHLIVHGEKKFKCDMCGFSCKNFWNLTTHIRSHTGEKPFKCSFCDKTFTRGDNLLTHKRQVHKVLHSESNN